MQEHKLIRRLKELKPNIIYKSRTFFINLDRHVLKRGRGGGTGSQRNTVWKLISTINDMTTEQICILNIYSTA